MLFRSHTHTHTYIYKHTHIHSLCDNVYESVVLSSVHNVSVVRTPQLLCNRQVINTVGRRLRGTGVETDHGPDRLETSTLNSNVDSVPLFSKVLAGEHLFSSLLRTQI